MPRCRCATRRAGGRADRGGVACRASARRSTPLGFTEILTPKVVAAATESGANVFPIDWFGRRAFLAQSPQFYKQMMVGVFERVYEVGPVFRAEPHDTVRHLAEYVSLDAELGFIDDHRDVMARAARRARGDGRRHRRPRRVRRLELLGLDAARRARRRSRRSTSGEAQQMIEARHRTPDGRRARPRARPTSAGSESGRSREHGSEFLFVTGYPMAKRPFYTHPDPSDPAVSNSFDLLFRGLELVTGGQRLHRYEDYLAGARRSGPRRRSRATSRPSATGCPRTAGSPSGSSAGSPG